MDETKINDALDRLETALITYGASLEKVGGATSTTQEVEPKKETINIALERTTALKSFATTYSTLDARVRNLREKVKPALLGLIFDLGQELSFLQRKNDDGALSTTDIALKLSKLEKEIAELEKEPQEEERQPAAVEPIPVNPPSPQSTQEEQKENISPKVHSLEIGTSNVVPNGRGGYSLEREGGRRNGKDLISLEEQKKWDDSIKMLGDHEHDHEAIVRPGVADIQQAVNGTSETATGKTPQEALKNATDKAVNSAIQKFNNGVADVQKKSDQLDADTEHGTKPKKQPD